MSQQIRLASHFDAQAISQVIVAALRESNAQHYSPEIIDQVEKSFSPAAILQLLNQRRMFVATIDQQVIATASLDGDVVRSVFVTPSHQGAGIGKLLMATLETVATKEGAQSLRVPSSITAEDFYTSLGFEKVRDEFHGIERTIIMEKRLRPSLKTVDCTPQQQKLRETLVLLYGRLEEIVKGKRPFGSFIEPDELTKKFHFNLETYPRLEMVFSPEDCETLADYATMSKEALLASATTPLERLMIATIWKQDDLGKIGHIAAGIVESNKNSANDPIDKKAPVFKQFGRHLSEPASQPIVDQHSLRAFRYLLGQDLCDGRHTLETVTVGEVKLYTEWVRGLIEAIPFDARADQMYEFDKSMYALGKATKSFIAAVIPSKKDA